MSSANIFDQLDNLLVRPISDSTGQPFDQVRILLVFLVQYPLGWFFHFFVHGTTVRHLFNVLIGFLIQYYVYRDGVLHVLLLTAVAYLMMAVLPRNTQQKYVMGWVLGYLTFNHLHRMYTDFGGFNLDISTFNMLQVCKLSGLAFCYKDGG